MHVLLVTFFVFPVLVGKLRQLIVLLFEVRLLIQQRLVPLEDVGDLLELVGAHALVVGWFLFEFGLERALELLRPILMRPHTRIIHVLLVDFQIDLLDRKRHRGLGPVQGLVKRKLLTRILLLDAVRVWFWAGLGFYPLD